jgi:hypothetical protein
MGSRTCAESVPRVKPLREQVRCTGSDLSWLVHGFEAPAQQQLVFRLTAKGYQRTTADVDPQRVDSMISGHTSQEELIEFLLQSAKPGGEAYKRLKKYQGMIERNVFIGEAGMRFLEKLLEMHDNIECRNLDSEAGACRLSGVTCNHREQFASCRTYTPARGDRIRGGDYGG